MDTWSIRRLRRLHQGGARSPLDPPTARLSPYAHCGEVTPFDSRFSLAYLRASMADVKTLAVVGAGQMGAGIAQVAAQSGLEVYLIDVSRDFVEKGLAGIRAQLDRAVGKG